MTDKKKLKMIINYLGRIHILFLNVMVATIFIWKKLFGFLNGIIIESLLINYSLNKNADELNEITPKRNNKK